MNNLSIEEVEHFVNKVIPKLESEINSIEDEDKMVETYNLYRDTLKLVAPHNFQSFNKYLEIDEDKSSPNKGFYHHRKNHLGELFDALNDMEIYDKYDLLLVSTPPRVGKSTTGIRFLSWIMGRYPEHSQLGTSYSDNITTSFYNGAMEIVESEKFKDVFPNEPVVNQNAKREEIWLKLVRRYPTMTFVPIGGSMTGRCEATNYLYCDDLVSGLEEALSVDRLDKLWGTYTVNVRQRKKDGAKEIHIATKWSVHDVITKLGEEHKDNPRCKNISLPCYNENGESAFNFFGGFSTEYYKDMERSMDKASFDALYKCEPIEREGLVLPEDELQYYFELPKGEPDAIISVCDSKNMGNDYVSAPVGYVYGEQIFIPDVVFNNGLPEVTKPLVANKWIEHDVARADIEMNNGGNYYAEGVDELIRNQGGHTSIRTFFSGNNKMVKIVTQSDFIKKHFVFKDKSTYKSTSEYADFMNNVWRYTQTGKAKHDDGADSLAMLSQLYQDLSGMSIKTLDRRRLRI